MTPPLVMLKAAQLLNEDAFAGKEACMVGEKEWACPDCPGNCPPRAAYLERLTIATKLTVMAKALQ